MKAGNQTCINWNNPRIQVHLDKYRFLDKTIPGAVCRNPLVVDKQAYNTYPWCYIEVNGAIAFDECRDLIVTGRSILCNAGVSLLLVGQHFNIINTLPVISSLPLSKGVISSGKYSSAGNRPPL
ncbi:hypothetical protein DPMN_177135 [Dreissena polymorpha]|uniref:Uncharacterized protein n=1 Tax=Dreissena polymorpha TaxID=45954 RepID=A0A9D4IIR8_DREPO|nr:hypothetical protein DPMN_177135 [Dreissena polymorpha]